MIWGPSGCDQGDSSSSESSSSDGPSHADGADSDDNTVADEGDDGGADDASKNHDSGSDSDEGDDESESDEGSAAGDDTETTSDDDSGDESGTTGGEDSETTEGSSGEDDSESEEGSDTGDVVDICGEAVPEDRFIDGIPAYSQCDASQSSAIWSNNGINTATESQGEDWVRTQWSGGYQCTEFASRYLKFRWGIARVPNGNAGKWCDGDPPEGLEKTESPVHGDIIVFAPGSCGASTTTGHVGVVDIVHTDDNKVEFVEENRANRRKCAIDTAACFIHVIANNEPE